LAIIKGAGRLSLVIELSPDLHIFVTEFH